MTYISGFLCSSTCISAPITAITICTIGNNTPCSSGSTCTLTMVCTSSTPYGGAYIATPTPVTKTPCVIKNNSPCGAGLTYTPTIACTTKLLYSGACISTPTLTICTVGNNAPCLSRNTCIPTIICTSGVPYGGVYITIPTLPSSTATPTPSSYGGNNRLYYTQGYKCVQTPRKDYSPNPHYPKICVLK